MNTLISQLLRPTVFLALSAKLLTVENHADMITKLFKSLIRPILEYGNLIWEPHYVADQQAIEGVQRHATKLISSISHCPYPERLKILNLPSLNYRRLRGDMIFLYQITHRNSDSSLFNRLVLLNKSSLARAKAVNFNSNFLNKCFSNYYQVQTWPVFAEMVTISWGCEDKTKSSTSGWSFHLLLECKIIKYIKE